MLTINQVNKLYEHGVKITMKKSSLEVKRGEYDPSEKEILIYRKNITSRSEMDMTILHEFIHARNDILRGKDVSDKMVEKEAAETYSKRPKVLECIVQLYDIKKHSLS